MSDDVEPEPESRPAEDPQENADEKTGEKADGGSGQRSRILIMVAAVVVLAVLAVGIYLMTSVGEDDTANDPGQPTITDAAPPEKPADEPGSEPPASSPATPKKPTDPNVAEARGAAEQAATAINERDVDAMKKLSCDPSTVGSVDSFPPEATARLADNPKITGDKATAQLELSIQGSEPTVVPLPMEKRDGKWCVP